MWHKLDDSLPIHEMEIGAIYKTPNVTFIPIKRIVDGYECYLLEGKWGANLTREGKHKYTPLKDPSRLKIGSSKLVKLLYG